MRSPFNPDFSVIKRIMDYSLFLLVSVFLLGLYLSVGVYCSRRIRDNADFFLAGRGLGFFPLLLTLVATHLGGGVILGSSTRAYEVGFAGIFYSFGIVLGFFALSMGIGAKLQASGVATVAELFETRYGSSWLKKCASLLSIFSLFGILIGQVVAARFFFLGLGIEHEWILEVFWIFVIAYTVLGGLRAVVLADMIQVLVIVIIFSGIFTYSLVQEPGHFKVFSGEKGFRWSLIGEFSSYWIVPFMFLFFEQDIAQRCFSASSKRVATLALLGAALVLFFFSFVPVYLGVLASDLGLDIPEGGSPIFPLLAHLTGPLVIALAAAALLAAIISTADSLLCAVSSNLSQDFSLGKAQGWDPVMVSKVCTVLVGLFALILGYSFDDVLDVLLGSSELSVSCLFVPVVATFFMNGSLKKKAAGYAMLFGALGYLVTRYWEAPVPSVLFSTGLSLISYSLCAAFTGSTSD